MVPPAQSVWAMTTSAALLLAACTIYSPSLLLNDNADGGVSGAAGAGNPCGTGSKCADGGSTGSSGAAGSDGTGGAGGGGGTGDASDVPILPYISSTTESAVLSIGLSTEGRLDWAHWGLAKASDYNHKNLPKPLLSTLATIGTKPITLYTGMNDSTFGWSDGIPTTSATSHNGVQVAGIGEGFVVTAPAGVTEARWLRLYVGVMAGTAQVQAKFSDPNAPDPPLVDLLTGPLDNTWYPQVIRVEYMDPAPGTTISVTWKVLSGNDAGPIPAVHLKAVSLAPRG